MNFFLLTTTIVRVSKSSAKRADDYSKTFNYFLKCLKNFPNIFSDFERLENGPGEPLVVVVKDYVAGMTDGFAENIVRTL